MLALDAFLVSLAAVVLCWPIRLWPLFKVKRWWGDDWPGNSAEAAQMTVEALRALDTKIFKPSPEAGYLVKGELIRRASGAAAAKPKMEIDWKVIQGWVAITISLGSLTVAILTYLRFK